MRVSNLSNDFKIKSDPNEVLSQEHISGSPLKKVNVDHTEITEDVTSMFTMGNDEEDLEKQRHELDVMINEFRHSAYNTLINIRKNIKNKCAAMLQREKNICDNLVRTKERERLQFEQENLRLTEENKKAMLMYNKMADYLFKLRSKTKEWKTAEGCFSALKIHVN